MKSSKTLIVIGGGIAGLTAAYFASRAGHRVILIERAPSLGGRIRAVRPTPENVPIDWGQHLLLGAYHETLRLAGMLGTRNKIHTITGATPFIEPYGKLHHYRISSLPTPLHVVPGLFALGHLSLRERFMLGRAAFASARDLKKHPTTLDTMTAQKWLAAHGQGKRAIARFWDTFIVSTLNTPPAEASAYLFAVVLNRGVLTSARETRGMLHETTLAATLVEPAAAAIAASGGTILAGRRALRLLIRDNRLRGVEEDSGTIHKADAVILAVPPWHVIPLCDTIPELSPLAAAARRFTPSPILSVDLWFDRHWLPYRMASPIGGRFHWFFSHPSREPLGFRVSLVLSAAEGMIREPDDQIRAFACEEITRFFPTAPVIAKHSFIIRETRATFRAVPGLEQVRPAPETQINGLFLAGDWTATGLPATIEGAVLSGRRAAEAVCRFFASVDNRSCPSIMRQPCLH